MIDPDIEDQQPCEPGYGHGRMPLAVKLLWLAFLVFAVCYGIAHLLRSLGEELGA